MNKLIVLFALLISICSCSKNSDPSIRSAVEDYVQAADMQDAQSLENRTHENFRVVWNGPGPNEHTIFSREVYLEKFRIKEWGGDPRRIIILDAEVCQNYASVHVMLQGNIQDFESLYTLVRNEGEWKILQESVRVSEKS